MIVVRGGNAILASVGEGTKGAEVCVIDHGNSGEEFVAIIKVPEAPDWLARKVQANKKHATIPAIDALMEIVELAYKRKSVGSARILDICRANGIDPKMLIED